MHVLDAAPEEGARPAEDGDALGAEEPFELRRLCANLGAAELIGGLWSHHGVHSLLGQHVWQAAAEKDKDAILSVHTHYTRCGLFVAGLDCSRLLAALSSLLMDDDVLELDEEEWVPVPIDSLTVKELKDELGSRGLRKGGTRDILIDRLVDALNGTKTLPRPEDPLDSEEVVPEALPVSFEQALGDTLAENLLLVSGGLDGCPSSLPVEMQPPHIRPRDEPTVRVLDYDPHLLALHKPSGLPGEEDKKPIPHLHRSFTTPCTTPSPPLPHPLYPLYPTPYTTPTPPLTPPLHSLLHHRYTPSTPPLHPLLPPPLLPSPQSSRLKTSRGQYSTGSARPTVVQRRSQRTVWARPPRACSSALLRLRRRRG